MTRDYVEANNASRRRLESFVSDLSVEDLAQVNADGWTVASLLAHMAYWDQRMVALLNRWLAEGVGEAPTDSDMINDSLRPIVLALDPQEAVRLCLESAALADAAMESISDEMLAEIEASGNHYRTNRSLHREAHMREIEAILAA